MPEQRDLELARARAAMRPHPAAKPQRALLPRDRPYWIGAGIGALVLLVEFAPALVTAVTR